MNILAPYSWIKEYCTTGVSPEEFAKELSLRSLSVERIEHFHETWNAVVVGTIVNITAHPQATKLRIAEVDLGNGRREGIVCGGANIAIGQRVPVALPGARVRWHGEGDLITLQETEIRGVKSVGMICAPAELGLTTVTVGERDIWDITTLTDAPSGTPLADALGMNDTVFDIEITTNRPDCMGIAGLAREGAAALSCAYAPHKFFQEKNVQDRLSGVFPGKLQPEIRTKKCLRYAAARIKNVQAIPSPWWLQRRLILSGHRPVNILVDVTNLVLQEFGQPLHVFDADRVSGNIVVREAEEGEKIRALDGKDYALSSGMTIIADSQQPLAIAGIMGGQESGASSQTTTVILESATFDALAIRKTSRALNLMSDAQLVFEKGLSPEAVPGALAYAIELLCTYGGGEVEDVADIFPEKEEKKIFTLIPEQVTYRLGVEISSQDMVGMLERLGFSCAVSGKGYAVTVPWWRAQDIEHAIDLTEEIARLYGYHCMPSVLPNQAPPTTVPDASLQWEMRIKRMLAGEGFQEFFGYSFVDGGDLDRASIARDAAVKVWNPLSEDLGYLRPSLLPSLLRDIVRNEPHTPHGMVFECSRIHIPAQAGELPVEELALVFGEYGVEDGEMSYRRVRGALEVLMDGCGVSILLERVQTTSEQWHPGRSADIFLHRGSEKVHIGTIGEIHPKLREAFGALRPVMVVQIHLETLLRYAKQRRAYTPVPEFQQAERSLAFVVDEDCTHGELLKILLKTPLLEKVSFTECYRGAEIPQGRKSMTYALTFGASDRTLTSDEIEQAVSAAKEALTMQVRAVLR